MTSNPLCEYSSFLISCTYSKNQLSKVKIGLLPLHNLFDPYWHFLTVFGDSGDGERLHGCLHLEGRTTGGHKWKNQIQIRFVDKGGAGPNFRKTHVFGHLVNGSEHSVNVFEQAGCREDGPCLH